MKVTKGTIIRTVLLIIALTNQYLTIVGKSPIPIDDTLVKELISYLFLVGTSLAAWWENNSFTEKAINADEYRKAL